VIEHSESAKIDPRLRDAVVAFLRDWLPAEARRKYRTMIQENPQGWAADPHFSNGIIVEHALRGNGIDEKVLGVSSLDSIWPDLLKRAVQDS
jgi:hypothetical protein